MNLNKVKIAVIIPCYNEAMTIAKVINDFKKEIPTADIYVYNNNSTDNTAEVAQKNDAIVRDVHKQGKGNVVRRMFKEVEADVYIMVDGDDTYPAKYVHKLIEPILNNTADIVTGDRLTNGDYSTENRRRFHNIGNNLVKWLINKLFKVKLRDVLTGYRVFSKNFVKNMPVFSEGFEIETEITLFALDRRLTIKEISISYRDRPYGSFSKLNTIKDGLKVIKTIFLIFKDYKPLIFFSYVGTLFFMFGLIVGTPVIYEFIKTGLILKVPSAVLATGLMMIATLSFISGLILDSVGRHYRELYELNFKKTQTPEITLLSE